MFLPEPEGQVVVDRRRLPLRLDAHYQDYPGYLAVGQAGGVPASLPERW
ncbi:hypothetical protein LCGC14_0716000 [marine sediment metagenome]|uniref:Uncharacterized protein n=1 Tax=marine sediment metagenome TaxID=412755 RepID=A0A0F9SZ86_9ZZZZ